MGMALDSGYWETDKDINVPAKADLVEVVRCKDCKHFVPFDEPYNKAGMCDRKMLGLIPEDGFCSYGERKDHD